MTSIADILGFQGRREATLADWLLGQQRLAQAEEAERLRALSDLIASIGSTAARLPQPTPMWLGTPASVEKTRITASAVKTPSRSSIRDLLEGFMEKKRRPSSLKQFLEGKYMRGETLLPEEKAYLGLTTEEEKPKKRKKYAKEIVTNKDVVELAKDLAKSDLGEEITVKDWIKYIPIARNMLEGREEKLLEPEEKETSPAQKSWLGSLAEGVKKWWGKLIGLRAPTGESAVESFAQYGQGLTGTPIVGKPAAAIRKVGIVIDPETGERRKAIETVDGAIYDMETGERLQ